MLHECLNTIKLLKIYESDDYINLLIEYQEGGTLADLIINHGSITESQARTILEQLLLAVDFMSLFGLVHRDLKPENILLHYAKFNEKGFDVRIADFGLSTTLKLNTDI